MGWWKRFFASAEASTREELLVRLASPNGFERQAAVKDAQRLRIA